MELGEYLNGHHRMKEVDSLARAGRRTAVWPQAPRKSRVGAGNPLKYPIATYSVRGSDVVYIL